MVEKAEPWAYHLTDHFRQKRAATLQSRERGTDVVRLHLGCGKVKFNGWVNIDNTGHPDVLADCTALPYTENYADEIMAIHVFEHIFHWKALDVLKHWYGILKPGGKLILEMPDLKKILELFKAEKPIEQFTMWGLYGGEHTGRIEDLHKYCWTFGTIRPLLENAGYRDIMERPCLYHFPIRDFRVVATK